MSVLDALEMMNVNLWSPSFASVSTVSMLIVPVFCPADTVVPWIPGRALLMIGMFVNLVRC